MPNVFEYTNYKKFLVDYYNNKKSINSNYSYQIFSQKAGFKSKASLANITSGQAALSKKKIFDVAAAMGLNKKETEYFDALVNFNEAKTVNEREFHFGRMSNLVKNSSAAKILEPQYEYYSNWYNGAIRELITLFNFHEDYSVLAKLVDPAISPKQARKSVELLLKLGMIKKTPSGRYEQTTKALTTGDEVKSLALQKYHQRHLALASESIDRHARNLRDISSLTAGVSEKCFKDIKKEIQAFRKHLMEIIGRDEKAECVYQVNFQLYPISKVPKAWGKPDA
jgi:uncharacterized protein (TIGR02147 family)